VSRLAARKNGTHEQSSEVLVAEVWITRRWCIFTQCLRTSCWLSRESRQSCRYRMPVSQIGLREVGRLRLEYDKLADNVKTKEAFYTEAAASLNRAEQSFQSLGGYNSDEPATLLLGKSELAQVPRPGPLTCSHPLSGSGTTSYSSTNGRSAPGTPT